MRWIPRAAAEETLTITPRPRSTIAGRTARQHHIVGSNDLRISAWISASVNSTYGLKFIAPPTLLIRMSMRPNRLRALARQLVGDLLHEWRAVDQCDRASFPGRPRGHPLPEALRRAGDDQDLAFEPTGEHSAQPPGFSIPARIVAFAWSVCSTMMWRSASKSRRS